MGREAADELGLNQVPLTPSERPKAVGSLSNRLNYIGRGWVANERSISDWTSSPNGAFVVS